MRHLRVAVSDDTALTVASQLFVVFCRLAGPILIARAVGIETFGDYSLILAMAGVATIFSDGGLGRLAFRRRAESSSKQTPGTLSRRAFLVSLCGGLVAAVGVAGLCLVTYGAPTAVGALLATWSLSVANTAFELSRADGHGVKATLAIGVPPALALGLVSFVPELDLRTILLAHAFANVVSTLLMLKPLVLSSGRHAETLGGDLLAGLAFAASGGFSTIWTVGPTLVSSLGGSALVGQVALALRAYQLPNAVAIAATTSLVPTLSEATSDRILMRRLLSVRRKTGMLVLSAGLASLGAYPILSVLTGPEFAPGWWTLFILVSGRTLAAFVGFYPEALLLKGFGRTVVVLQVAATAAAVPIVVIVWLVMPLAAAGMTLAAPTVLSALLARSTFLRIFGTGEVARGGAKAHRGWRQLLVKMVSVQQLSPSYRGSLRRPIPAPGDGHRSSGGAAAGRRRVEPGTGSVWSSMILSAFLIVALFARDGRYQGAAFVLAALLSVLALHRMRAMADVPVGGLPLFILWTVLSVGWSAFAVDSIQQAANFLVWTLGGLVIASYRSLSFLVEVWARAGKVAVAVTAGVTLLHEAGVWQPEVGVWSSKNHLGYAMASSLVPILARDVSTRRAASVLWFVAALVTCSAQNTQTGVLLCIAVPCLFGLAWAVRTVTSDHLRAILLVAGLVVTVAVAFSYDDVVVSGSAAVGRDSTLSGRSDLWPEVVDAIGERPVAGTGIGGVWLRPNESPTREILDTLPPSLRDAAVYAHSGYLDVALQVGLLGGIILAVLVSRAVFRSFRLILYGETKYYSLPFVALILVLLANVTESRVFNDQAWVVFVAVFSLLLGSDVGAASKGEEEMADVGPQLGVAATIQVRA